MADVTISRTYKSAWVQRMLPAILKAAEEIEGHRIVQKRLEQEGVEPDSNGYYSIKGVDARTKAEILLDHFLFTLTLRHEDGVRAEQRGQEIEGLISAFNQDAK